MNLHKSRYGHGGNIWAAASKYGFNPEKILDFSANINPLGPPQAVVKRIKENLDLVNFYPEPEAEGLKLELAKFRGLDEDNLLVGNGAAELIYLINREVEADRIVLPAPTFSEYGRGAQAGIRYFYLTPDLDFHLNVRELARVIKSGDLVFLCNPNNPTGSIVKKEDIIQLVEYASEINAMVAVDEAFIDFSEKNESVVELVNYYSNLFVLGSLTKIFALPGLRIGYLAANLTIIDILKKKLPPWRVNVFAGLAGEQALKEKTYMEETLKLVKKERQFLTCSLKEGLGLEVFPSHANYLLVNLQTKGVTGTELYEELACRGILIRKCSNFEGLNDNFIRIAVRAREENVKLIKALKGAIDIIQQGW